MKKILIVFLTLCCFFNLSAQKDKNIKEEKLATIQIINQAILNDDSIQQTMLDEFIATYGMTSDVLTLQAVQFEHQENYEKAAEKLDEAINIITDNDAIDKSSLYNLRISYCNTLYEKLIYADLSLKADPKNVNSLLKRYQINTRLERYKDAEKDIKKAIKLTNGDPELRSELARIYLINGNEKKAMKELDNILKNYPSVADARELRALVHYYNGRLEPFIDDYLYYLQMSHDLDMAYINEVADTAYDYILDYANQILQHVMEPEDVAYWNYFESHLKLWTNRDVEGVITQLDKALSLTSDTNDFRGKVLALQLAYYDMKDNYDKELEIIAEIEKIINRNNAKTADWILSTKAQVLRKHKQFHQVAQCYNQLIENNTLGEDTDSTRLAYYYYARADLNLDKLNNPDGALADMDSVLAYNPDFVPYIYKHARICEKYFNHGDYIAKIQADYEKILAIDTVTSENSYRHFALAMLGRKAEAEEWLQRVTTEFGETNVRGLIDYNGACMYALINDTYNATRLLMDALERGNISCEQLNEDADFDNIRETPEFKSILKITCSDQKE